MDILKTIKRLQEDKRERNIVPDHVTIPDLLNAVREEAEQETNELCKAGKVGVVNTLNSKALYIKNS